MWTCPKCATKVDPSFEVCWACGTSVDGVEDPTFVPADDVVVQGSPTDLNQSIVAATDTDDLVECYSALDLMQAQFIAQQLTAAGIPATADTQDHPDQLSLVSTSSKVRVLAKDFDRARDWLATFEETLKSDTADSST